MRKLLPALVSAIFAVSFSSLAAAQTQTDKDQARPDTNHRGTSANADARAAGGATDDASKDNGKKKSKSKKTSKKSKSKDKASKAAGGASASTNGATAGSAREPSTNSSPSQTTGAPGDANQGSVHNDETKK